MERPFAGGCVAAVASHYDQLDRFYRDIWGLHIHHGLWQSRRESYEEAQVNLVDLISARARLSHGFRVCDVGCGYGAPARYLAENFKTEVIGFTISDTQFRHAISMESKDLALRFVKGDWLENDLPDEAFDAVLAIESTEPMSERPRFFSESARVLKRGGRLVVATWVVDPYLRRSHFRWLINPLTIASTLEPLATPAHIVAMIESGGLQLEHSEDITVQVTHTWPGIAFRFLTKAFRHPGYLKLLFGKNRKYTITVPRIWLAFRLGALRYCVFTARKP